MTFCAVVGGTVVRKGYSKYAHCQFAGLHLRLDVTFREALRSFLDVCNPVWLWLTRS
jgi:hypothetical protein